MPSETVCDRCGTPLSQQPAADSSLVAASGSSPGSPATEEPAAKPDGPYGPFVASFLAFLISCSAGVFFLSQWRAVHSRADLTWGVGLIALAAVIAATVLRLTWRRLRSRRDLYQQVRNLGIACLCTAVFFPFLTDTFGWLVGRERSKLIAVQNDWEHLKAVGHRISDRRNNAGPLIADYIAMYKEISPDVRELRETTARLLLEVDEYQKTYPEFGDDAEKARNSLRIAERQGELLQQQVDIAAKMSDQNQVRRIHTWESEMQPLLDSESALDARN